jgi:hypothetical protein
MVHFDDPSLMLPEERLRAIAALLLLGLERFKQNGGTAQQLQTPTQSSKRKEAADDLR